MWALVKVGEDEEMVPQPKGVPRCDPFMPKVQMPHNYGPRIS